MFPTSIRIELAEKDIDMMLQASTHDAHRTIECRSDVVVHAFDKVVVRLTSLAVTDQYLAGGKCERIDRRTTSSVYHRSTHPHQSRTPCS